MDEYWKCWRNEYLASLRDRPKTGFTQRNPPRFAPAPGTVVLIEDNGARNKWKMGIIQDVHASQDGKHRSARVRIASGTVLNRSIRQLYPLEVQPEDAEAPGSYSKRTRPPAPAVSSHETRTRPSRAAASAARASIQAGMLSAESDDE